MDSLPYRVDGVLEGGKLDGFPSEEIEYKLFEADLPGNAGPVSEVAFFHKPTTSLFVTDAVVWIPERPPPIFRTITDIDNVDFWPKSVLQAVFVALRQEDDGSWPAYDALKNRLIRAPILRAFADARAPDITRRWVDDVSKWPFDRILTSHFASPVLATPAEFRRAFARLDGPDARGVLKLPRDTDWKPLDDLNDVISTNNLGAPIVAGYK